MRRVRFRPLHSVREVVSPLDRGPRFFFTVAGAAVLFLIAVGNLFILFKVIGLI